MSIDWEKFAERVPAGCICRFLSQYSFRIAEGIIVENKPYAATEKSPDFAFKNALRFEGFLSRNHGTSDPLFVQVQRFEFLLKGEWLTFEQVMKD